jgi:hypothetical protein
MRKQYSYSDLPPTSHTLKFYLKSGIRIQKSVKIFHKEFQQNQWEGLWGIWKRPYIGFEVFTAVVKKSNIFWDMTPCTPLSCARRFGGTYRLHLQDQRNRFSKPASKQVASLLNSTDYTASYPRRWYFSRPYMFLRKLGSIVDGYAWKSEQILIKFSHIEI